MGFRGRLEAIRAPTMGKARKSTKLTDSRTATPTVPRVVGSPGDFADRVRMSSATMATNPATESKANDHASHTAARFPLPRV
jgi:hypothetical protein